MPLQGQKEADSLKAHWSATIRPTLPVLVLLGDNHLVPFLTEGTPTQNARAYALGLEIRREIQMLDQRAQWDGQLAFLTELHHQEQSSSTATSLKASRTEQPPTRPDQATLHPPKTSSQRRASEPPIRIKDTLHKWKRGGHGRNIIPTSPVPPNAPMRRRGSTTTSTHSLISRSAASSTSAGSSQFTHLLNASGLAMMEIQANERAQVPGEQTMVSDTEDTGGIQLMPETAEDTNMHEVTFRMCRLLEDTAKTLLSQQSSFFAKWESRENYNSELLQTIAAEVSRLPKTGVPCPTCASQLLDKSDDSEQEGEESAGGFPLQPSGSRRFSTISLESARRKLDFMTMDGIPEDENDGDERASAPTPRKRKGPLQA